MHELLFGPPGSVPGVDSVYVVNAKTTLTLPFMSPVIDMTVYGPYTPPNYLATQTKIMDDDAKFRFPSAWFEQQIASMGFLNTWVMETRPSGEHLTYPPPSGIVRSVTYTGPLGDYTKISSTFTPGAGVDLSAMQWAALGGLGTIALMVAITPEESRGRIVESIVDGMLDLGKTALNGGLNVGNSLVQAMGSNPAAVPIGSVVLSELGQRAGLWNSDAGALMIAAGTGATAGKLIADGLEAFPGSGDNSTTYSPHYQVLPPSTPPPQEPAPLLVRKDQFSLPEGLAALAEFDKTNGGTEAKRLVFDSRKLAAARKGKKAKGLTKKEFWAAVKKGMS